jgi:hypothetical protein
LVRVSGGGGTLAAAGGGHPVLVETEMDDDLYQTQATLAKIGKRYSPANQRTTV